ncbi:MAG: protein translocase SEC61 complex subunit gamma [Nanoarchaeota archaeon]
MLDRLKAFMNECVRVFKITQKPSKDELKVILKASALGMALIGIIGFIIQIAWILVF